MNDTDSTTGMAALQQSASRKAPPERCDTIQHPSKFDSRADGFSNTSPSITEGSVSMSAKAYKGPSELRRVKNFRPRPQFSLATMPMKYLGVPKDIIATSQNTPALFLGCDIESVTKCPLCTGSRQFQKMPLVPLRDHTSAIIPLHTL